MVGQRYYFLPHDFDRKASALSDDVRDQGLAADVLGRRSCESPGGKTSADSGHLRLRRCAGNQPSRARSFCVPGSDRETRSHARRLSPIAASSATEEAREIKQLGHGVLTYTLLAGLQGVESGPLKEKWVRSNSADGAVDVLDWLSFAAGEVPRLTARYTGEIQDIQVGGKGSSFPILTLTKNKRAQ